MGILEILNEPLQGSKSTATLILEYYPKAYSTIREAEDAANVTSGDRLTVQVMVDPSLIIQCEPSLTLLQDKSWDAGDPTTSLANAMYAAYDDHRYLKNANPPIEVEPSAYLEASCKDNRDGEKPMIIGEWSLSPPTDVQYTSDWAPASNVNFYKKWWEAQVLSYEGQNGWLFWSWKAQLNDYRWSYKGMRQWEAGV